MKPLTPENEAIRVLIRSPLFQQFLAAGFWDAASVDLVWRHNGRDVREQADWLKDVWYAVRQRPLASSGPPDEQDRRVKYALAAMRNMGIDTECGACMEIAFTGCTTNQHDCKSGPPVPAHNPRVERLMTDAEQHLTELVRETLKDAPPFAPCVFYHDGLDETHVLLRDCSYYEDCVEPNGVRVLRANHGDGAVIGLVIPGRLRVESGPLPLVPAPTQE